MDPQSHVFTPYTNSNNDAWRLQNDVVRLQQLHTEHAERIARLERRQDDDARMKSVWGNGSPFPSVLSGGTPQQAPLQHPPSDHFRGFDDDPNHMMSSLHLDPDDEPRRGTGATSRANSVRFDESANQNHFSHSSRTSMDVVSRTSSGLGGLRMDERTPSHKSDGRASSAHSIRSAASGRASSLNLDLGYGMGDSSRSPLDTPGFSPGLMLLGSVPAIIRCWMNTNFKHDALLYAAVCTGSYHSFLDLRLIRDLGFEDHIMVNGDGVRTVELPVYFPEAVHHPASSRSSSPAPQLPTLSVEFHVVENIGSPETENKAIQIFLGSDTLRSHNADILFSSNSMTLFDDERSKLSIPLVRPENEAAFKSLYVTSGVPTISSQYDSKPSHPEQSYSANGLEHTDPGAPLSPGSPHTGKYRPPGAHTAEHDPLDNTKARVSSPGNDAPPTSQQVHAPLPMLKTRTESFALDQHAESQQPRSASNPAVWNNWRRDGPPSASTQLPSATGGFDWANASRTKDTTYQRKDTGIKVLKPKLGSRTFSASQAPPAAPPAQSTSGTMASPSLEGRSRFFDDGRQRSEQSPNLAKASAVDAKKENVPGAPPKTKANPIGGASAFSWLTSGGPKPGP